MSKKLYCVCFALAGFLAAGLPARAQSTTVIGVFDFQRSVEESVEGKKVLAQIKQKEQAITSELGSMDRQIQSLEGRLGAQKAALSFEAQQQLSLDLERLRTQRARREEDLAKDYRQLQFTLVSGLQKEVVPILQTVAKEKGFNLVLEKSSGGVLYFAQVVDITPEVIRRFDLAKAAKVPEAKPTRDA